MATNDQLHNVMQDQPQESRRLAIQRCLASLEHACQCIESNCRLASCPKMKRIVSHAKTCERKRNGICAICKQLMALNCYHAKNCQETKCPVPFCLNIKYKFKQQQRMAEVQILKRRIATMRNRGMIETIKQTSPGSSNPTSQPSPDTKPLASQHVSQPGIGMKPLACPPLGALQAVQQVQAAAARQSFPHMVPTGARPAIPHMVGPGNYGNNTMVNHPPPNPALMCAQQQHMQEPMNQMMLGAPNRMMGMRNMANWDFSNFSQNMQPQNTEPGQPMGLRPQSQMMGPNNMPNPARSAAVGIPQGMSNPEQLLKQCTTSLQQLDLEQLFSNERSTVPCTVSNAQSFVGTVGAVGPSTTTTESQDTIKLIQVRLLLLMHAYECPMIEAQTNGEVRQCSLRICSTMKQLVSHMVTCQAGTSCTAPHCSSSSQIISHWKNCTRNDCPVCVPLKQAFGRRKQQSVAVQTSSQSYPPSAPGVVGMPQGLPNPGSSATPELILDEQFLEQLVASLESLNL